MSSTIYSFSYMIFQLCRDAGLPIWHRDVLCAPTGTVDIGFITDEANEVAPWRGPIFDVKPLDDNLVDTVEQAQGADHATLEPTDTNPVESATGTSRAPSSSRSTPPSVALVLIATIQKLEAQTTTLLHHINSWM